MTAINVLPQDVFPQFEHIYDDLLSILLGQRGDKELTLPMMRAQAWRESGFNPIAVSPTGCRGLFQFTRAAWSDMDEDPADQEDRFDIYDNVNRAVKLMTVHMARYRIKRIAMPERWKFSLAAFNQGAGNVDHARTLCVSNTGKDPSVWENVHPLFDQVLPEDRALEVKVYVSLIVKKLGEYLGGSP